MCVSILEYFKAGDSLTGVSGYYISRIVVVLCN